MRLGLDLLFLIPGETGGRETYARQLISAMFAIDPSLSATAFVNREAEPELRRTLGSLMPLVALPVSPRSPSRWALGELALLPRAAARTRVEVLHSLANFGPASGRFRRVLTIHDLQYRAVPELLTPTRRAGTAALIGLAARRAHRLIAVSAFTAGELVAQLGLPGGRIEEIPNGAGIPPGDAIAGDELRARHRLGTRPVALTVSAALPHKNLATLLDALAVIPVDRRPVLVLIGAGTDGSALREHARAAGVQDDARLLGFQPAEALEGFYRLARCAVTPSLYEGFGLAVLEAMVRGIPVACADIPALREVAAGAAIWFDPRRATEIAAAIERLLADPTLARRLSEAGLERAEQFTWTRAGKATLACYRRALEDTDRVSR